MNIKEVLLCIVEQADVLHVGNLGVFLCGMLLMTVLFYFLGAKAVSRAR